MRNSRHNNNGFKRARWSRGNRNKASRRSKMAQTHFETAQRGPRLSKTASRWPRRPHGPPRRPQMGPPRAESIDVPSMFEICLRYCFFVAPDRPRRPQKRPRWPQDCPRGPKETSSALQEDPQDGPKRHKSLILHMCFLNVFHGPPGPPQDGPRGPQDRCKTAQEALQTAQ